MNTLFAEPSVRSLSRRVTQLARACRVAAVVFGSMGLLAGLLLATSMQESWEYEESSYSAVNIAMGAGIAACAVALALALMLVASYVELRAAQLRDLD